ncbi:MAG: DUF4143 domain-containing protein [Gammaproteobacteria bacterium]|nr:DUF4143 domain-containing protein [Gammaproteobacteria bacterium]
MPPHHQNFNKRLVKTPKLYFLDTGLANWLLGIQNSEQLTTHVQRGALFETWAISELLKTRYNAGETSNLYFWRDRFGHEADLLIDHGTHLLPLEKHGWFMAVTPGRYVPISLFCQFGNGGIHQRRHLTVQLRRARVLAAACHRL